jgi:hypothetical protein
MSEIRSVSSFDRFASVDAHLWSGTDACTEHTGQELMRALSALRNSCVHRAYASGTWAVAEHAHQFPQNIKLEATFQEFKTILFPTNCIHYRRLLCFKLKDAYQGEYFSAKNKEVWEIKKHANIK